MSKGKGFFFVCFFVLFFFVCFLLIHTDSWGVDFFRRGVWGGGVPSPPPPQLESTAYSAGLLFAHEVRHEIKLVLPQPEFGQLLDAVQTHFYH